jgi:hypothetical protein
MDRMCGYQPDKKTDGFDADNPPTGGSGVNSLNKNTVLILVESHD